jgi:DNA-binding response OmpR family regulator
VNANLLLKGEIIMSKILIIEDEPDIAAVLRKRLVEYNYNVVYAADAYSGVDLAHRENPDLVILDLMLPAGGGLAALKNMRMSQKLRYIPVVVITGMKDEDYKEKVLQEGVDAYLEKPYDAVELIGVISSILQKKKGE